MATGWQQKEPIDMKTKAEFDTELAALKAEEKSMLEDLKIQREAIRDLENEMSDAAPFQCGTCGRGVWLESEAHTHLNTFSRKRTPYRATLIQRTAIAKATATK